MVAAKQIDMVVESDTAVGGAIKTAMWRGSWPSTAVDSITDRLVELDRFLSRRVQN